eukprot:3681878-Pyramimonas_sp.AAC.1
MPVLLGTYPSENPHVVRLKALLKLKQHAQRCPVQLHWLLVIVEIHSDVRLLVELRALIHDALQAFLHRPVESIPTMCALQFTGETKRSQAVSANAQ